jgi:hypothetical protein
MDVVPPMLCNRGLERQGTAVGLIVVTNIHSNIVRER